MIDWGKWIYPEGVRMLRSIWLVGLAIFIAATSLTAEARNSNPKTLPGCQGLLLAQPFIIPEDSTELEEISAEFNMKFVVMAPNPASLPYSLQKGYAAKTSELKRCKSAKEGRYVGLVHCPPSMFRSEKEWEENRVILKAMGYSVLGADEDYLVRRDSDGKLFYSDYDFLGMYDAEDGSHAYTEALRKAINKRLGRRIVRHGPLDEYDLRHTVKIKYPLLAYVPNQPVVELWTEADARAFYSQHGLPWVF